MKDNIKQRLKDNSDKMAFLISTYTEPCSPYALIRKLDGMLDADYYIHTD